MNQPIDPVPTHIPKRFKFVFKGGDWICLDSLGHSSGCPILGAGKTADLAYRDCLQYRESLDDPDLYK